MIFWEFAICERLKLSSLFVDVLLLETAEWVDTRRTQIILGN